MNYAKDCTDELGKYFNVSDFKCHCLVCSVIIIDSDLIVMLDRLRESIRFLITITSGYRCPAYQAYLKKHGYPTATGVSQHTLGRAADIRSFYDGETLAKLAEKAGFQSIGIAKDWIHVDLRPEHRRWTYP